MKQIARWREIFRYTAAQKKPVWVGEEYVDLTGTQAFRFEELTRSKHPDPKRNVSIALEKTHYALGR